MTNFKLSSKMHLLIVISSIIIALGLAIGLICQFVGGGFFNYGGDLSSYNTVTVNYALTDYDEDFNSDSISETCLKAFKDNGVSGYTKTVGDTSKGGVIEFRLSESVSEEKLIACVNQIQADLKLAETSGLSTVSYNAVKSFTAGTKVLAMAAIVIGSAVAVQFIYYIIRYSLTMGLGALLANAHNVLLFLALLAITRIQVSSSVVVFVFAVVIATMISSAFLFANVRKNAKKDAKMPAFELVDVSANNAILPIAVVCCALIASAALIAVATMLGSLSFASLLMPALCTIFAAVAVLYGTAFFTPAVYARFKLLANAKANSSAYTVQTKEN